MSSKEKSSPKTTNTQTSNAPDDCAISSTRAEQAITELTTVTVSRVCHDLIGPIAAVRNGLEVYHDSDDDDMRAHALDLVSTSAESAVQILRFCRMAYGAMSQLGEEVELEQIEQQVRELASLSRVAVNWNTDQHVAPRDLARATLLVCEIAVRSLVRGGEMTVMLGKDSILSVEAQGPMTVLDANVGVILQGSGADAPYEPTTVNARYIADYVSSIEAKLSVDKIKNGDSAKLRITIT